MLIRAVIFNIQILFEQGKQEQLILCSPAALCLLTACHQSVLYRRFIVTQLCSYFDWTRHEFKKLGFRELGLSCTAPPVDLLCTVQ